MIRYYESIGLLEPSSRSAAGYRQYGEQDLHALGFIRRARELGFPLKQVAALMALWRDKSRASAEVKQLAQAHIAELEHKAQMLREMAATLKNLADHCHGDERPDCPILEGLQGEAGSCPGAAPACHAGPYQAPVHSVTNCR
jgi:Cu(I)-responsive transcriptional regulator